MIDIDIGSGYVTSKSLLKVPLYGSQPFYALKNKARGVAFH